MNMRIVIASWVATLACGTALADRVAGIAGIAPARATAAVTAASVPALRTGTISSLRADGTQVEIDGKWYVLKAGRSLLLRKGLPVGADVLAKGQQIKFSLASTTPGEMALGVVHVP